MGEIDANIIVVNRNTLLISMGRSTRQKFSKEATDFTQTIKQMDLIDIYRAIHLMDTKYIFFQL